MDTRTRREHLAAAIRLMPGPISAADLAHINASAGFSPNRNTARKDGRALVARGVLAVLPGTGNRSYTARTDTPS